MLPDIDLTLYPEHAQRLERLRKQGGAWEHPPCWVCGRPCRSENPVYLNCAGGGFIATDPNDPSSERWGQPIGHECLRRHPELKPYTFR